MFIQIMNRMMNEARFRPVAADTPTPVTAAIDDDRPAVDPGPERGPELKTEAPRAGTVPMAFRIYASAFNTAVHGG